MLYMELTAETRNTILVALKSRVHECDKMLAQASPASERHDRATYWKEQRQQADRLYWHMMQTT